MRFLVAAIGLFLSILFFGWASQGCSFPLAERFAGCPWLGTDDSLSWVLVWDATIYFLYTYFHSMFAGAVRRDLYMLVTGIYTVVMIVAWQPTGVVLWQWLGEESPLISLYVMGAFVGVLAQIPFSFGQFFGFQQSAGPPPLRTTGLYAVIRHPMHVVITSSLIVTPFMTLDRMLVFALTLVYLAWAIPLEDAKLVALYGADYEAYRRRVPALIPWVRV